MSSTTANVTTNTAKPVRRLLITGSHGQLGTELQTIIAAGKSDIGPIDASWASCEVVPTDYEELDITDSAAVEAYLAAGHFDACVNCAAATNVDGCESDEAFAHRLNAEAPGNLARACAAHDVVLVHVSTDYVLSGTDPEPQDESAVPAPNTAYGRTKLDGEKAVTAACPRSFICRTAWLYGANGKNFVRTMVGLGRTHDEVTVVSDQHGSPTNANDLAYEILALLGTTNYGLYHVTAKGQCSWADFAQAIMDKAGLACHVRPCTTAEYAAPAPRPAWSVLDNRHLRETIGDSMRPWEAELDSFLAQNLDRL
ncbi:MAG: dTDP-4-dehydrorhamnose reductase [Atopobiaceae bacterium]|jgi:dTDP-4-dehydrorhamnose reductase|nr:dTDP-4-dehydrorhamnose reductase [Atopobiaceae bacterium]MCH4180710.1 dTDP-4-dehydrorhamnose reductase [Atopobiaceae bacterium]MCH4215034.1 dTDP-4-dehydrorhamnose reductase [Atopobiaceae bacterium]MCI1226808.1 dTDP-4-dehydrorhamnose reductase [Atopobiaceae bacterium]MCI1259636.1 dTDP-4-dehydrorhamnose reductase [Atopobiaceae bacterium]